MLDLVLFTDGVDENAVGLSGSLDDSLTENVPLNPVGDKSEDEGDAEHPCLKIQVNLIW